MHVLLDTHALLWWLADDPALSKPARRAIGETMNSVYVSAASAWEISTKVRLGKLPSGVELAADFLRLVEQERFLTLPITSDHAIRAGLLPGPHRDPFDRMLIAQAQAEGMPVVTNEVLFERYGVGRIW
jgi:PIN domain nuclease of toxin-antitoxin system